MNQPSDNQLGRDVAALRGPNGTIEVKQMNGVQGWHSGYLTSEQALALASELTRLAKEVSQ